MAKRALKLVVGTKLAHSNLNKGYTKGPKQAFWAVQKDGKSPAEGHAHDVATNPFWKTKCDFCSSKPIYMFNTTVVCRGHKDKLLPAMNEQNVRMEKAARQLHGKEYMKVVHDRGGLGRRYEGHDLQTDGVISGFRSNTGKMPSY